MGVGIHVARARFGSPFVYMKLERWRKEEFKFQRLQCETGECVVGGLEVGMGMYIRERQRNGNRGVFADGGLGASCMDCTRIETLRVLGGINSWSLVNTWLKCCYMRLDQTVSTTLLLRS